MNARRALFIAVMVVVGGNVQAQHCSGGADGGMDATGNQCNQIEPAVAISANAGAAAARESGLEEYAKGHYATAAAHFRRAAEAGDVRSAEILALMYRVGPRLYGESVPVDAAESARWAMLAASRRVTPAVSAAR